MRQVLDEHGLEQLELEFLGDWFLDPATSAGRQPTRRALLFEAAELPAHHIKAGNIMGTECELPRIVEGFAELCADAAKHTDAKIVYEFMPYDVQVNDVDTALGRRGRRRRTAASRSTRGTSASCGSSRRSRRIPSRFVSWVELSDGYEYARTARRGDQPPPAAGEGEFPIAEYVAVFRELGYDGPWGVEVLSEELRNLPIEQIFDRAYETTSAQLAASRERSVGV